MWVLLPYLAIYPHNWNIKYKSYMFYTKIVDMNGYFSKLELKNFPFEIPKLANIRNYIKDKTKIGTDLANIRDDSYLRTKRKVKEYIISNLNEWRSFWCLTFANDVNIEEGNKEIVKFFKKVKRIYPSLKYFVVIERTKKGRIHYHFLTNQYFIKSRLEDLWGNGIVLAKKINDNSLKLATYMTKYLTKQNKDNSYYFFRKFLHSRNILKSIVYKGADAIRFLLFKLEKKCKEVYNFNNNDLNYSLYEFS